MKALILAAGLGNRMRPLTDNRHKTLLEVDGRTIIDRIMDGLVQNGVTQVVIVTGYRAEELMEHVQREFPRATFQFVHNPRYAETNNIYSMALAFEQMALDDDLLLIESDLIYTPDVIERAIHTTHENVALVSPYVTGLDGTVVQVTGGRITSIFPPHLQDDEFNLFDKFKTLNVYRFSKEFCANEFKKLLVYYAQYFDDNCYYELILGILIYMQREDIYAEVIENDRWAEVDDPNDLDGAEFVFNKDKRLAILEHSFGGYWNYEILDFCFIRNMYFPPESVLSEIKNNLPYLLQNYGSKQGVLEQKLAYVLLCDRERLIALNGASQVYPLLPPIVAGRKVLIPDPTFGEYPRMFRGAETYDDRVGVDRAGVEEKVKRSDVAVFVNPNNPSGTTLSTDWLLELVDRYPDKLFIIDESFIAFAGERSIMVDLERQARKNVLVITSMSKSYGVPGMRLGFVYSCDKDLLATLRAGVPIWNMNSLAEFYLEILLKNKTALKRSFAQTAADRDAFIAALEAEPFFDKVYPSGGDFIMVRTIADSRPEGWLVKELLATDSIYIKEVTDKFRDGRRYYRFAVRLPEENTKLIAAIRRAADAKPAKRS